MLSLQVHLLLLLLLLTDVHRLAPLRVVVGVVVVVVVVSIERAGILSG